MYSFSCYPGQPLIIAFQGSDRSSSITVETVNLVDSYGVLLSKIETGDVFVLGDNAFAVRITPPSVVFYWQILGKDAAGYTFLRISDTAIEVSTIDMKLGTITKKRFIAM